MDFIFSWELRWALFWISCWAGIVILLIFKPNNCFLFFLKSTGTPANVTTYLPVDNMGLEDFEPIFTEAKAEWARTSSGSAPLRRFLLHVFAPDYYHLKFQVTDFHSDSFQTLRSVTQLEDLRDAVGIGGSWSEFVDYTVASIRQDARLVLDKCLDSDGEANARLVAQKSKGLPLISISLTRISDSAARDAMENMSFGLYKAFKLMENLVVQEQAQSSDLTKGISTEKSLQDKRQKLSQLESLKKEDNLPSAAIDGSKDLPDKQAAQGTPPRKALNRVVPAFRRAKVRGALLKDTDDEKDD